MDKNYGRFGLNLIKIPSPLGEEGARRSDEGINIKIPSPLPGEGARRADEGINVLLSAVQSAHHNQRHVKLNSQ
jgi:hypothetical protein